MRLDLITPLLFAALALYGAYSDIRFRTIPNAFNLLVAVSGIGAIWFAGGPASAGYALAHLAVALAAGMLIFALGMWGGGDAKFYAATAGWFEIWHFPRLAMSIALTGLILLIVWFGMRRMRRVPKSKRFRSELPYGVAIAVGGFATLAFGSWL